MWTKDQQRLVEECASTLKTKRRPRSLEVTKVSQWDAEMLDGELMDILNEQLKSSFEHIPKVGTLFTKYQPELSAFLRFLVWAFTVRVNKVSPGILLQNLRFRNERLYNKPHLAGLAKIPNDLPTRGQRFLHGIFTVLVPLVWERMREKALMEHWAETDDTDLRSKAWWMSEKLARLKHVLSMVNLFAFLYNGKYRNITERVLQMRLVHDRMEAARAVSFEFINQQLLFDGFTDVMMCILPLIDWGFLRRSRARIFAIVAVLWKRLKSVLRKVMRLVKRTAKQYRRRRSGDEEYADDASEGSEASLDASEQVSATMAGKRNESCPVCESEYITMPYALEECGHLYCYYCVKTIAKAPDLDSIRCLYCSTESLSAHRS